MVGWWGGGGGGGVGVGGRILRCKSGSRLNTRETKVSGPERDKGRERVLGGGEEICRRTHAHADARMHADTHSRVLNGETVVWRTFVC